MTILIEASLACEGNCAYCYNAPIREAVGKEDLDLEKVISVIGEFKGASMSLHGGEPLLLPMDVLEKLCEAMYLNSTKDDCPPRIGLQSSGMLLTDEHIELFTKYHIKVGLSLDGDGELNRFRTSDPEIVINNMLKLKEADISSGILIVISKANGLPEQRKAFKEFVLKIHEIGVQARLLPCRHSDPTIQLTMDELLDFYSDMLDFLMANGIRGWSPYSDVIYTLRDNWEHVWCRFTGCDPFATKGGIIITAGGDITTCHKFTDQRYIRDPPRNDARAALLLETDCKGCQWFDKCRGGCPADAVDFDWRNKTIWCQLWKMIYTKLCGIAIFTQK